MCRRLEEAAVCDRGAGGDRGELVSAAAKIEHLNDELARQRGIAFASQVYETYSVRLSEHRCEVD